MPSKQADGIYILLVSVHGLIRAGDLELGRDADTGGQTLYVVELAKALGKHPDVQQVDLLTRSVIDGKVSEDYSIPEERLADKVNIIRIPFGPRRYLRKEVLWPYLDNFVDGAMKYLQQIGRVPDVVHGHYADAGYAAANLAAMLAVPMVFTGHSLGRLKRLRLLDKGMSAETIEDRYRIIQRIEAEEVALDSAALVIASTRQEIDEQYRLYDKYQPVRMLVIPPGVDVDRFYPTAKKASKPPRIRKELKRFLQKLDKPVILALARPDPRKNLPGLLHLYGKNKELQERANLVIVAGTRKDIRELERGQRDVITEILVLVDTYDLYGKVAYPKGHDPEDVPDFFRLAAESRGVFVNSAFSEGFGLTLIEAAASGLPVVTTNVGGPVEIIENCQHGLLVNPLDDEAVEKAIATVLEDKTKWDRWSQNGIQGAVKYYSWTSHVDQYIRAVKQVVEQRQGQGVVRGTRKKLVTMDRALICDMDNTLLGDKASLKRLLAILEETEVSIGFGVATGRNSDLALEGLKEWDVPTPDFVISSVGTGIRYGPNLVLDRSWIKHVSYRWRPDEIREILALVPGLKLQSAEGQREFKISYNMNPKKAPSQAEISQMLRQSGISVKVIYSHQQFLDILPIRASKGLAIRYLAMKWDIPIENVLVAGDSGNDEEMLVGNNPGVVVGNHDPELEHLRGMPGIYFAEGHYAQGIIEAIEYFDFLGSIRNINHFNMDEEEETDG